ncbi:MAG: hypothetical protein SFX72_21455 [Isosphaeraceae bacterium]|nr:hypothetical protein [Isosphaeraceae bacterium]
MSEQRPRTVPWIERIAHWVPGYGGYLERGNRRAADQALREVVSKRLVDAKSGLEAAVRDLVDRGRLDAIAPVERIERRLNLLAERVRSAGAGNSDFYSSGWLDPAKAESVHSFDFHLLEQADVILEHTKRGESGGDWLAHLEQHLAEFERRLDERTKILEGIR